MCRRVLAQGQFPGYRLQLRCAQRQSLVVRRVGGVTSSDCDADFDEDEKAQSKDDEEGD